MSNLELQRQALETKVEQLRKLEKEQEDHARKIEAERLLLDQEHQDKLAAQALLDEQTKVLVAQFDELYKDKSFVNELQKLLEIVRNFERFEHDRQKEIAQLLGKLYQLWYKPVIDEKFNPRYHTQVHIPGFICEKLAELTGLQTVQIQRYLGFIK